MSDYIAAIDTDYNQTCGNDQKRYQHIKRRLIDRLVMMTVIVMVVEYPIVAEFNNSEKQDNINQAAE